MLRVVGMRACARSCLAALATALTVALACGSATAAAPASSQDQSLEYARVISVFDANRGHLPPCAFTQAQLEAALAGLPKLIASTVPDFKRAVRAAIAAHKRGDCKGVKPTGNSQAAGIGGAGAPPETSTTPGTATTPTTPTTPATTPPAATAPTTPTTTAPPATAPTTTAPVAPAPQSGSGPSSGGGSDRTPLAIAAIAIGALLLAGLGLWALARTRGWESPRLARARHAWGEAGYRTSGVWAEFADWLRPGR
jgi:hypothetical protein